MAAVSLEACCVSRFEPSVVSLLDNVGDVVGQSPPAARKEELTANEENSGRVPASLE